MKSCNSCGAEKPADEFYRRSDTPDGRDYRCKACTRISRRATERRRKHVVTARSARRRATQSGLTPEWCRKGEAADAIADVYMLAELLTEITGFRFTVDHIIPLAKGGEHRPDNLSPLRAEDNSAKRDRLDWSPKGPVFLATHYIDSEEDL